MREQLHGESGPVHIPGYLLPVRLSTLAISYRLLVALRRLRRSFIGDLDGLCSKHLLDIDSRGADLMIELIELIQKIPALPQRYDSSSTDPPRKARLSIPRCTPRRFYYRSRHLARLPCNVSTPSENRSFTIQPLTPIPKFPGDISKLLSTLEQRFARFIPRDLTIIKLRYGADSKPTATLFAVCRSVTLTPEGVRHILHERLNQLRQSPEILESTNQLASFCHQHNCILTPALLSQWLPPNPTHERDRGCIARPAAARAKLCERRDWFTGSVHDEHSGESTPNRFDLPFLVRVLSELNPNLPTWPTAKTLH